MTAPTVWMIFRQNGVLYRDAEPHETTKMLGQRIPTDIPTFIFEGPAEPFLTVEAAQAHAQALIERDGLTRWIFRSEFKSDTKTVITFQRTNGAGVVVKPMTFQAVKP